jgi:hypothetical protein
MLVENYWTILSCIRNTIPVSQRYALTIVFRPLKNLAAFQNDSKRWLHQIWEIRFPHSTSLFFTIVKFSRHHTNSWSWCSVPDPLTLHILVREAVKPRFGLICAFLQSTRSSSRSISFFEHEGRVKCCQIFEMSATLLYYSTRLRVETAVCMTCMRIVTFIVRSTCALKSYIDCSLNFHINCSHRNYIETAVIG